MTSSESTPQSAPRDSLAATYVMQALMAADTGDQERSSDALQQAVDLGVNETSQNWFALEAAYGVALQLLWRPSDIKDWYLPLYSQLAEDASPVTQGLARMIMSRVAAETELPEREKDLLRSYSIEPSSAQHLPTYAQLGEGSPAADVRDHVGAVILATRMMLLEMMMYADHVTTAADDGEGSHTVDSEPVSSEGDSGAHTKSPDDDTAASDSAT